MTFSILTVLLLFFGLSGIQQFFGHITTQLSFLIINEHAM